MASILLQPRIEEPVVYIGHRLFDARSVLAVTPLHSILVAEGLFGDDKPGGPQIYSLEQLGSPRRPWTSDDLDLVCNRLLTYVEDAPTAAILPYAACSSLDAIGERPSSHGVMSVPTALKTYLDDKYATKTLFSALHLPEVKWFAAAPDAAGFIQARERLGHPYVARAPFGSTGARTFLIESGQDAHHVAAHHVTHDEMSAKWLFEEYVVGCSININAVASQRGLTLYPPSIQILGEKCCASTPFAFCGNDYAAAQRLPEPVRTEVRRQTSAIARQIVAIGFRGAFGIDFLVDLEGQVYPCEINPRFQNSTALLNYAFSDVPDGSPVRRHISIFAPAHDRVAADATTGGTPDTAYSQITIHNTAEPQTCTTRHGLAAGLYAYDGDRISYLCVEHDPRAIKPGTFLAVDTVEEPGMYVEAGATLARLVFHGAILAGSTPRLADWVVAIVHWVRAQVSLVEAFYEVAP